MNLMSKAQTSLQVSVVVAQYSSCTCMNGLTWKYYIKCHYPKRYILHAYIITENCAANSMKAYSGWRKFINLTYKQWVALFTDWLLVCDSFIRCLCILWRHVVDDDRILSANTKYQLNDVVKRINNPKIQKSIYKFLSCISYLSVTTWNHAKICIQIDCR